MWCWLLGVAVLNENIVVGIYNPGKNVPHDHMWGKLFHERIALHCGHIFDI